MTLSRIFKTIFLIEFIKGLSMAVKEMFKKSKIKKKTELTVFLDVITIKDEKIAITEKK